MQRQPPRSKSLQLRLLLGMLGTIFLSSAVFFLWYRIDLTTEHTGEWDANIRNVAQMTLVSLPEGIEKTSLHKGYALPHQEGMNSRADKSHIQVWKLPDQSLVLRTPNAPTEPLVPSMRDGFSNAVIGHETWRVYSLTDAERRIQIQVGKPGVQLRHELHQRLSKGLLIMGGLFILLAGVGWFVVRQTLTPVMRMSDGILNRNALDLQPLAVTDLPKELRPLVEAFNGQLARVEAAVQNERRF